MIQPQWLLTVVLLAAGTILIIAGMDGGRMNGGRSRVNIFTIFTLLLGIILYTGGTEILHRENLLGKPIPFAELKKDQEYTIVEIINNSYLLVQLVQYKNEEPRLIKDFPEKIRDMKKGTTFRLKDATSTSIIVGASP